MNALLKHFELMDDAMAEVYRQKSLAERTMIGSRMWMSARSILRGSIRTLHPDWTEERVNREIACRISHGVVSDQPP